MSGEACFSVSIMDDDVYTESVRYFVMSFSLANSNDQFTGSVEATVFIEDDGQWYICCTFGNDHI